MAIRKKDLVGKGSWYVRELNNDYRAACTMSSSMPGWFDESSDPRMLLANHPDCHPGRTYEVWWDTYEKVGRSITRVIRHRQNITL